ncbi:hypothetical protein [Phytopseudomonas dryadis]|uniref:hypothetical protein n=1 Tax=Phytopseudomonas dryadis TaxID=2487520 RepID=UPI0010384BB2|nr:hypothetical protein [Pseudomonas dryadis]
MSLKKIKAQAFSSPLETVFFPQEDMPGGVPDQPAQAAGLHQKGIDLGERFGGAISEGWRDVGDLLSTRIVTGRGGCSCGSGLVIGNYSSRVVEYALACNKSIRSLVVHDHWPL